MQKRHLAAGILWMGWTGSWAVAAAAPLLWEVEESKGPQPLVESAERAQMMRLSGPLLSAEGLGAETLALARVQMPVLDGVVWEVEIEQRRWRGENRYTLVGRPVGRPHAHVVLSVEHDAVFAVFEDPHGVRMELQSISAGQARLRQVTPDQLRPCGGAVQRPASPTRSVASATGTPASLSTGTVTVDVAVVYSPAARIGAGGTNQIRGQVELAIDQANLSFSNSAVDIRYALVYLDEIAYAETGDIFVDLDRLSDLNGFIDEVHAIRDYFGADLVQLIIEDGGPAAGGLAWIGCGTTLSDDAGFSISVRDQLSTYVLAHEFGHNFGCDHDHDNASSCRAHSYSYGYRFQNNEFLNRTIMAYSPGFIIGHFSNPDVNFFGSWTGTATNNNAQTLRLMAPQIAAFRPHRTPAGIPFQFDGSADFPAYRLSNPGMTIYAAVRGTELYVATWTPDQNGPNDHFIFISDELLGSASVAAPWSKTGQVAVNVNSKPYLAAESMSRYISWFNAPPFSAATRAAANGGQMEGVIDLVEAFGYMPATVYIASAAYGTADGGALAAAAPSRTGGNLASQDFLVVSTVAITDENANGIYDRLDRDDGFMAYDIEPTMDGSVTIRWASFPGQGYWVQASGTLAPGSWTTRTNLTAATGELEMDWTDPAPVPERRMYRIELD